MFKQNDHSGLSWLPLISRMVWAKHPRDPGDLATLPASSLRERARMQTWLLQQPQFNC